MNINNSNINFIEVYIGEHKNNRFCCDITKEKYDNYLSMFSIYNNTILETTRRFYKTLICETINKKISIYTLKQYNYDITGNKLITYYKKETNKSIEFPCLKKYIHEEHIEYIQFIVDKNISIYFSNIDNIQHIKMSISTDSLDKHKLNKILDLFT
tara:strand:+ start:855 stop:1322 length:468 start_codon:yes stop_codon:yes gene_type:complete